MPATSEIDEIIAARPSLPFRRILEQYEGCMKVVASHELDGQARRRAALAAILCYWIATSAHSESDCGYPFESIYAGSLRYISYLGLLDPRLDFLSRRQSEIVLDDEELQVFERLSRNLWPAATMMFGLEPTEGEDPSSDPDTPQGADVADGNVRSRIYRPTPVTSFFGTG